MFRADHPWPPPRWRSRRATSCSGRRRGKRPSAAGDVGVRRTTRRAGLLLCGAITSLVSISPRDVAACDVICVRGSTREELRSHRYVLVGRVVDVEWEGPEGRFTLEPIRVWKGKWPGDRKRFRTNTHGGSGSCGFPLVHGAYYLIFARDEPQQIGECDHQPIRLSAARKDVAELDRLRRYSPLSVPKEALER
jgi:hypothetical protein